MSVFAALAASTLTVLGLATTCKATVGMTISNSGGVGVATVSSMNFSGCGTNGVCTGPPRPPENSPGPAPAWSSLMSVGETKTGYESIWNVSQTGANAGQVLVTGEAAPRAIAARPPLFLRACLAPPRQCRDEGRGGEGTGRGRVGRRRRRGA